ncbi:dTDP-4-dehydrorhamnose 3,5-epimerase [Pelagibacterales bacterium SAG-MED22]|nr:dTDP-4-dehydrorhamnose 3,5-epimerase [Pelagibacterales bacterium SAG-MED22]
MKIKASKLPGCYEILNKVFSDTRGKFVKTFHAPTFKKFGLNTTFKEEYYSISLKYVVRGLHFQLPPHDHVKLVYCVSGNVKDVVVDLRVGSPTYGKHLSIELSSEKGNMVYIPKGMAHGFCGISKTSTLVYKTSTVYSPNKDTGIKWDSVGIFWPKKNIIISERDRSFLTLNEFKSPFKFGK